MAICRQIFHANDVKWIQYNSVALPVGNESKSLRATGQPPLRFTTLEQSDRAGSLEAAITRINFAIGMTESPWLRHSVMQRKPRFANTR